MIDHRALDAENLRRAKETLKHEIPCDFSWKTNKFLAPDIASIEKHNIVDACHEGRRQIGARLNVQLDRWLAAFRPLNHIPAIEFGEEFHRGRTEAGQIAFANNEAVSSIVDKIAGVIGDVRPAGASTGVCERCLSRSRVTAEQDSAAITFDAGRMDRRGVGSGEADERGRLQKEVPNVVSVSEGSLCEPD